MKTYHALINMLTRRAENLYVDANPFSASRMVRDGLKQEILNEIEKANLFVFSHEKFPEKDITLEYLRGLSPPFQTCWFQLPDNHRIQIKNESFLGMFLHEESPLVYKFAMVMDDPHDSMSAYMLRVGKMDIAGNHEFDDRQRIVFAILGFFLGRFTQNAATGIEKTSERVSFKRNGEKIVHKLRRIIHIVPKTEKAKREVSEGRTIEWTHRFSVRGHWRKIKGIGKNRAGDYCVSNFTYVTDFVKGDKNLPFVKKTRVVVGDGK